MNRRVIIAIVFVLIVAATTTSYFLYGLNQANTRKLLNAEERLKKVKMAFEERGRLLDGLSGKNDDLKSIAEKISGDLEKANEELEMYKAVKSNMDKASTAQLAAEKSLKDAQQDLIVSRKTAESSKIAARNEIEGLRKKLADMDALSNQLKRANNTIEKLNKDFRTAEAELFSQKQLLSDKQAAIKKFEDLKVSPAQIRDLLAENAKLNKNGAVGKELKAVISGAAVQKMPSRSLKILPLDLELPLVDKRLNKPLESKPPSKLGQP